MPTRTTVHGRTGWYAAKPWMAQRAAARQDAGASRPEWPERPGHRRILDQAKNNLPHSTTDEHPPVRLDREIGRFAAWPERPLIKIAETTDAEAGVQCARGPHLDDHGLPIGRALRIAHETRSAR